jgi:predicted signal transduction protein with EAL and GGDEF domain
LTGELAKTVEYFDRIRMAALVMRTGALLLLLWVGSVFSRRLRSELVEQARLREAITASKQLLEVKVQQRTAELEAANQRLATLSATDALTGLANRRSFDQSWEAEWQRASRQGLPLAIAMVDVDQFKAYNVPVNWWPATVGRSLWLFCRALLAPRPPLRWNASGRLCKSWVCPMPKPRWPMW